MRKLSAAAAAAAAACIAGLAAGHTLAAPKGPLDQPESSSLQVSTAGVDFRNAAEVEAFYARLQRAALFVCGASLDKDRADRAKDRACAQAALKTAVGAVNHPTLTALNQRGDTPILARGW